MTANVQHPTHPQVLGFGTAPLGLAGLGVHVDLGFGHQFDRHRRVTA